MHKTLANLTSSGCGLANVMIANSAQHHVLHRLPLVKLPFLLVITVLAFWTLPSTSPSPTTNLRRICAWNRCRLSLHSVSLDILLLHRRQQKKTDCKKQPRRSEVDHIATL
jgi:hypothetical protein